MPQRLLMASNNKAVASAHRALTTAASVAASAMLARTVINEFLPYEVRGFIFSRIDVLRGRFSSDLTIVIEEMEGFSNNQVFEAAKTYLSTKIPPSFRRLKVSKEDKNNNLVITLDQGEELVDVFEGIEFRWQLLCREVQHARHNDRYNMATATEERSFELIVHKKYKDQALGSYLPYIIEKSKFIKDHEKTLKLYMNENDSWCPINLHHPATFETLAMDAELKQAVMDDLDRFINRKEYYKRIGKAWKRGYLLYGPPGTGKSSLVGAMANYLKFDIYDLELSEVDWNATLQRLLVATPSRSILVVEDIDCAIELQNRDAENGSQSSLDNRITLSGLLNAVDGLWSSSGEERIIVFTTNYKERLDPALLRPGRMDMHIHMGYCSPSGFRLLAFNYLAIDDHPLFEEIEGLITEVEVTPSQVAEELMRSDDANIALQRLLDLLKRNRTEGMGIWPTAGAVALEFGGSDVRQRRAAYTATGTVGGWHSATTRGRGRRSCRRLARRHYTA